MKIQTFAYVVTFTDYEGNTTEVKSGIMAAKSKKDLQKSLWQKGCDVFSVQIDSALKNAHNDGYNEATKYYSLS